MTAHPRDRFGSNDATLFPLAVTRRKAYRNNINVRATRAARTAQRAVRVSELVPYLSSLRLQYLRALLGRRPFGSLTMWTLVCGYPL